MTDRRMLYRVLLKLLVTFSIFVLLIVLFRTLTPFLASNQSHRSMPTAQIDLHGMQVNEIRKSRWGNKEVAVLKRSTREFMNETKLTRAKPESLHESLNALFRSQKLDYFVYLNRGDSGNCPLFYDARGFKDTCSGKLFDTTGREKGKQKNTYLLEIPPHYFKSLDGRVIELVVGQWN